MHVGPGDDFRYPQQLVALLRATRLLPLAEWFYARGKVRAADEAHREFREKHPAIALPPPSLIQRTYGNPEYQSFHHWGWNNAQEIAHYIQQYAPVESPQILEWGCGLGRIASHLVQDHAYTGVDIDRSSIAWCAEHLQGRFTVNNPNPPLPFPNDSWDVVFAVSIFTHLSEKAHLAWRDEIFRVLKPGGVFIFTVHGEREAGNLTDADRQRFDQGNLVTKSGVAEGSRTYLAYHPDAFVKRHLTAPFEPVAGPETACNQTIYVRRKPA